MEDSINILNLIETCDMVQLTTKRRSLRLRGNKFYKGEYFITLRNVDQLGEIKYTPRTSVEALEVVEDFMKGLI